MRSERITRRQFFKGAGAAAITAAVPGKLLAAPGYEKSPLQSDDIDFVNKLKNDPAVLKRFREKPTWREALSMIRVLAREDTSEHEKREKKLHRGATELFDARGNFVGQATRLRITETPVPGMSISRYIVVTAAHVVEAGAVAPWNQTWEKDPKYDIAVCEINEKNAIPKGGIIPDALDFDLHDTKDVSWKIGSVQGIDIGTGTFKIKSHPSMISTLLSPHVVFNGLNVQTETSGGKKIPLSGEELRLAVINRDEFKEDPRGVLPRRGMSGAGWIVDGEYAGFTSTVVERKYSETEIYGLEFIIDRSFVRNAILGLFKKRPSLSSARASL